MSPAFSNGHRIPSLFTCDGDDINPELRFDGVPKQAKSLALLVDDPDSPSGNWLHWSVWNIDPSVRVIPEDSVPSQAVEGETDFSEVGYGGPCPGYGEHEYRFTIVALDVMLDLPTGAPRHVLEAAMKPHIIASAALTGRYQRIKKEARIAKNKLIKLAKSKAKAEALKKRKPKVVKATAKKVLKAKPKSKANSQTSSRSKLKVRAKAGAKSKRS